jgi:hypothetical protein
MMGADVDSPSTDMVIVSPSSVSDQGGALVKKRPHEPLLHVRCMPLLPIPD